MKITVIGLGRLGAVAASGLAAAGHEVTGLDVDERRVKALTDGRIPFYEPGLEECLTVAVNRGNLRLLHTSDFSGCVGRWPNRAVIWRRLSFVLLRRTPMGTSGRQCRVGRR